MNCWKNNFEIEILISINSLFLFWQKISSTLTTLQKKKWVIEAQQMDMKKDIWLSWKELQFFGVIFSMYKLSTFSVPNLLRAQSPCLISHLTLKWFPFQILNLLYLWITYNIWHFSKQVLKVTDPNPCKQNSFLKIWHLCFQCSKY